MKSRFNIGLAALLLLRTSEALAATHYVDANSANPTPPYADWVTAALTIQDAVDLAASGDCVVVTNGVYAAGGRAACGLLTNRVVLDKAVAVQSVHGPASTFIQGFQVQNQISQNTNGSLSVRCAYVTNGAVLAGFTLTNGGVWFFSRDSRDACGAGAWCEPQGTLSNCVLVGNVARSYGGGVCGGMCQDCLIASNTVSWYGGGAHQSTLKSCTLAGNQTTSTSDVGGGGGASSSTLTGCALWGNTSWSEDGGGGGVDSSTLTNCQLAGNVAETGYGGGANGSILVHCLLVSNVANMYGGGARNCALTGCVLTGNQAASGGGGVDSSSLTNCQLVANSSQYIGGGARDSTLDACLLCRNSGFNGGGLAVGTALNCCIVSNTAAWVGGGAFASGLTNCSIVGNSASSAGGGTYGAPYGCAVALCIVWGNQAPASTNFDPGDALIYCCTIPMPSAGAGNLTNNPLLADPGDGNFRLQDGSPCINAGNNLYAAGPVDLDGRPRLQNGVVDLGAYEYQGPAMSQFIAWLQQYGLATDGSDDPTDPDHDGMNNYQEWVCGTNPTNALSVLKLMPPSTCPSGTLVSWQSVTNRTYGVQRAGSLSKPSSFSLIQKGISGQPGTTTFLDTNAAGSGPFFYRVRLQ